MYIYSMMKAQLICVKCGAHIGTQVADKLINGIVEGMLCAAMLDDETVCGGEIKRIVDE